MIFKTKKYFFTHFLSAQFLSCVLLNVLFFQAQEDPSPVSTTLSTMTELTDQDPYEKLKLLSPPLGIKQSKRILYINYSA